MANAIDRVVLVGNERLDKPDADRLQAFVDEAVQRQFGGMLGHSSGLNTPCLVTYDAGAATLTFGRFQYYLGDGLAAMQDPGSGKYKGWRGAFHEFSPTSAGQNAVASIAAAKAAAATANPPPAAALPYIYVQPSTVNTSTEARRQWVAGAETPVSLSTVQRVKHSFSFTSVAPESMPGWACIGKIVSWSAAGNPNPGTPEIQHYSYLDNSIKEQVNGLAAPGTPGTGIAGLYPWMDTLNGDVVPALSPPSAGGGGLDAHKDLGLVQVLIAIRSQIARVLDSTKATPWWTNPNVGVGVDDSRGGLKQLWQSIYLLYNSFHSTMPIPWAVGRWNWDGAAYVLQTNARNVGGAAMNGAVPGDIHVTLPQPPPAGYSVSLAVASPRGAVNQGAAVYTMGANAVDLYLFACDSGNKANANFDLIVYIVKN